MTIRLPVKFAQRGHLLLNKRSWRHLSAFFTLEKNEKQLMTKATGLSSLKKLFLNKEREEKVIDEMVWLTCKIQQSGGNPSDPGCSGTLRRGENTGNGRLFYHSNQECQHWRILIKYQLSFCNAYLNSRVYQISGKEAWENTLSWHLEQ